MKRLQIGIKLRKDGKLKESIELLLELVKEYPDKGDVNYQCAWTYDVLGLENEAIPYYEKAIRLGLPEKELIEAYLGLGSTYRAVGEYEKSKELLVEAIKEYDDNSLKVFLAMTYYNLEEHSKAMQLLLELLAVTSEDESIRKYQKAINFYSDKLDQLW